jgi:hypothetical protein
MSVGICVASPEGMVIATDSRQVVQTGREGPFAVATDEAEKLFLLNERVAVATYGEAAIGGQEVAQSLRGFDAPTEGGALAVAESLGRTFAAELGGATRPRRGDFVHAEALRRPIGFMVCGFDGPLGHVYEVNVRAGDSRVQLVPISTENPGIQAFGQSDGIDRLLKGVDRNAVRAAKLAVSGEDWNKFDLLSYELVELRTLEMATTMARSLIEVQYLAQRISRRAYASQHRRIEGCGGKIQMITVTPEETRWAARTDPAQDLTAIPAQVAAAPSLARRSA